MVTVKLSPIDIVVNVPLPSMTCGLYSTPASAAALMASSSIITKLPSIFSVFTPPFSNIFGTAAVKIACLALLSCPEEAVAASIAAFLANISPFPLAFAISRIGSLTALIVSGSKIL